MGRAEYDGEHIWLRQSVTFAAHGETRTVEIAIPLRPGASPEEVERLLGEAEAGMAQLTSHLDASISALRRAPAASEAPAPAERPAPARPAAAPAPTVPAPAAAAAPAPRAALPPASEPPARPAARPAPAPARAAASGPLATPAPSGGDITRQQFLAAAQQELGLNARQAMERLGVRTLEGLNLREALEALRRQQLRDGLPAPAAPAAPAEAPASARPQPPEAPRYFEEEDDDTDFTFSVAGEDALEEEFAPYAAETPAAAALDPLDEIDELDLEEVPDFGPPPSARSARQPHATSATPARPAAPAARPEPASAAAAEPTNAAPSRGQRLITQMRTVRGGGAPTTYQRTAFRNVVVRELGEPEAAALVRGIWRLTPERLGPEQLEALVSWGKQETFAEEVTEVLAALRAERTQEQRSPEPEQPPASPKQPPRTTTSRGRPPATPRRDPGGR